MPIVTDPFIIEFDVHGVVLNQETVNRFFYSCVDVATDIDPIVDAFHDHVVPSWLTVISTGAALLKIVAQVVRGGSLFTQRVATELGTAPGDCMPPFVAWDYTLLRGGALERNGYKRFAGVPEVSQNNGVRTTAATPDLDALAVVLGNTFSVGLVQFGPVIRRTKVNHVTQNPPTFYTCSGAVYSKIGSQNSRKFGHGR